MTKVISINGTLFALPDGMAAKDVQALAGFLISLTPVQSEYDYDNSDYMYYASPRGVEVRLDNLALLDMTEAQARNKAGRERYEAKRAAEKAAAGE